MLWSKSKKLQDLEKINNYFLFLVVKSKRKLQENIKMLAITHAEDFKKYFHDVDLTPSSWWELLSTSVLF